MISTTSMADNHRLRDTLYDRLHVVTEVTPGPGVQRERRHYVLLRSARLAECRACRRDLQFAQNLMATHVVVNTVEQLWPDERVNAGRTGPGRRMPSAIMNSRAS